MKMTLCAMQISVYNSDFYYILGIEIELNSLGFVVNFSLNAK